jgi:uncharacterized protein (TIGR03083 family)
MTDWGALYRANLDAVSALARGLTPEEVARPVPGCPDWTVHDVLAHLAGGPADALSGRMEGAPGPTWTAHHVGERSARTVEELVAELEGSADAVTASLEGNDRPALVWNLAVHHADLHEALGKPAPAERYWRPVLEGIAPRALGEHADAFAGVPDYEQFRALFSRRSRAQMAAWDTGLDQDTLDAMCIFGPRDDDQPVPG